MPSDWLSIKIINHSGITIGNNFSVDRGLWFESVCNGKLIIGDFLIVKKIINKTGRYCYVDKNNRRN
jgi:hypothetical protein